MLQDPQVLGNDHNKPHSLMSDPISTMYFHNMPCDLLNKILFKPISCLGRANVRAFHENPNRIHTELTFINP